MTVWHLLAAIIVTIVASVYAHRLPSPWPCVVYAVVVVAWLLVLLDLLGFGGVLNQRIG